MSPVKSSRPNNAKSQEPSKKPIDFEVEEVVPSVPAIEKLDEDGLPIDGVVAEEEAEEEASLDDEELNPFGDKWEE